MDWYTPVSEYPRVSGWLMKNLKYIAPWMLEEMEGVSDGCQMSLEEVILNNHYGLFWSARGLCTSISFILLGGTGWFQNYGHWSPSTRKLERF